MAKIARVVADATLEARDVASNVSEAPRGMSEISSTMVGLGEAARDSWLQAQLSQIDILRVDARVTAGLADRLTIAPFAEVARLGNKDVASLLKSPPRR
jgi:hypothetical protein